MRNDLICPKCDSENVIKTHHRVPSYGLDDEYTQYQCQDCGHSQESQDFGLYNPWSQTHRKVWDKFEEKKRLEARAPSLARENRKLKREVKNLKRRLGEDW